MKAIVFSIFVLVSLFLYCLFYYTDPRNFGGVESFPIDPTGKHYNPL